MPFSLKNVGATYQRLVDKVFHDQIGRNLEAYVDDMVIKSTFEEDMLADIKETLKRGPVLGHLITKQGIRAKPSKVKAITDVEQPKTLKDIQSLNGKLAALSHFLSRGAKRSSTLGNEEICRGLANAHSTNARRGSDNVPHSFDREYKRSLIHKKGRRVGFYEIKEFLGCLKDCQVLDNLLSMPCPEGFGAFAWRIPLLVTVSKTTLCHSKLFQGFNVQLGEVPIQAQRGDLRARGDDTSSSPPVEYFNDFLTLYPIPSEYRVILPKSNQTVFEAPPRFIYRGSNLLVVLSSPLLLSCAKLIVVSHLLTSSEEMAFRNFIYTEDDKDLLFLPKEPSPGFGTDSGESPKPELFVVHPGSVAARINDRKCKTKGWSSRPPIKRKLAAVSSTSRATRLPDVLELKNATAYHLKISVSTPLAWKNHLENQMDVIKKLRGKFDVTRSKERAREEECEGLRVKYETVMTDFEKNPTGVALQENISALSTESNVTSLKAEKERLEAIEVSLCKEVEELKQDRREVVSKVIPYAVMELVYSDDIDPLAPIKVLLSKKPPSLQRHVPSRTQVPLPTSQRATPSSAPVSYSMSPPTDAFVVKP
ncbi:hypothetical protein Tco_0014326 [Tanacetum coccineum]